MSFNSHLTQVKAIPIFNDNYIWVIINRQNRKAVAIDPGKAAPLMSFLDQSGLSLEAVLITHHHHDHTGGLKDLENVTPDLKIYGPCLELIQGVTHLLKDGEILKLDCIQTVFSIMHTPGHTAGHICYYAENLKSLQNHDQRHPWLFCGDTLFSGGCGRLFEGTPEQMYSSLQRICELPDNTQIFCTHEYTLTNLRFAHQIEPDNLNLKRYMQNVIRLRNQEQMTLPSTLLLEKQINPFLRTHESELVKTASRFKDRQLRSGVETFAALRSWKDIS